MADREILTTADIASPDPAPGHAPEANADQAVSPETNQDGNSATVESRDASTSGATSYADAGQQSPSNTGSRDERSGEVRPLFSAEEADTFRGKWRDVQSEFVDQPREAVERADRLVAELMQRLAAQFAESRATLEQQWDGQQDVSTEDLRVAMTSYRSFFERLLAA